MQPSGQPPVRGQIQRRVRGAQNTPGYPEYVAQPSQQGSIEPIPPSQPGTLNTAGMRFGAVTREVEIRPGVTVQVFTNRGVPRFGEMESRVRVLAPSPGPRDIGQQALIARRAAVATLPQLEDPAEALFRAVKAGNYDEVVRIVNRLRFAGESVNASAAVDEAVRRQAIGIADYLLENTDTSVAAALAAAVALRGKGSRFVVDHFLQQGPTDEELATVAMEAVRYPENNNTIIEYIINRGAILPGELLPEATEQNNLELVQRILRNYSVSDEDLNAAIANAIARCRHRALQLLLPRANLSKNHYITHYTIARQKLEEQKENEEEDYRRGRSRESLVPQCAENVRLIEDYLPRDTLELFNERNTRTPVRSPPRSPGREPFGSPGGRIPRTLVRSPPTVVRRLGARSQSPRSISPSTLETEEVEGTELRRSRSPVARRLDFDTVDTNLPLRGNEALRRSRSPPVDIRQLNWDRDTAAGQAAMDVDLEEAQQFQGQEMHDRNIARLNRLSEENLQREQLALWAQEDLYREAYRNRSGQPSATAALNVSIPSLNAPPRRESMRRLAMATSGIPTPPLNLPQPEPIRRGNNVIVNPSQQEIEFNRRVSNLGENPSQQEIDAFLRERDLLPEPDLPQGTLPRPRARSTSPPRLLPQSPRSPSPTQEEIDHFLGLDEDSENDIQ